MLVTPKAPKEADFGISARKNKSLLMDFPAPSTFGMTNVGLQEGFTNNKISQDEALFHPGIPKPAAEKS